MPDIFSQGAYHGTYQVGEVTTAPHIQICATANINAANQLEATFWINSNGDRVDSNLGNADYRIRDKNGALVSGLAETDIVPDINGYYQITPVSAALIYDLSHYVIEIEISIDGVAHGSSIGLVNGE